MGAAVARVLRSALSSAAEIRALGGDVDAVIDELERSVAAVLREAQAAADDIIARAEKEAAVIAYRAPRPGSLGDEGARSSGPGDGQGVAMAARPHSDTLSGRQEDEVVLRRVRAPVRQINGRSRPT